MGSYLSFGGKNKYYGYIPLSVILYIFSNFIYGYNYNNSFQDLRMDLTDIQATLYEHKLIHQIFCFIGASILSRYIYKYESKKGIYILSQRKTIQEEYYSPNKIFAIALFIIMTWIIVDLLISRYMEFLKDLDFWMFELIIMYLFNAKIFHIKLYGHQIFAFVLNIIPCILKITAIILENVYTQIYVNELKYTSNKWLIPVGIIFYIILLILNSYSLTKIKWLMDIKNFSPTKLLLIYGISGTILYIVICTLSTFVECPSSLKDTICYIQNGKSFYLENFILYVKKFKGHPLEIIIEFISNFFGALFFFGYRYFSILIIKYLSPIHIIFLTPLIFFFQKISLILKNLIKEETIINNEKIINKSTKFILDFTGDIVSIIGFLIFLEIIELKFCNLNYNYRDKISIRAFYDYNPDYEKKSFLFLEDGDIEEINDENSSHKSDE